MKQEMRRSQDVGVRNGKHYLMGIVLIAITSVVTLAIADVARTVKDAPVNNAIQAGEIKLLRQKIEMVELQIKMLENNQLEFKRSVDKDFDAMREASEKILSQLEKMNATIRAHVHQ